MTIQRHWRSAIYSGTVLHRRLKPKRHRLSYRVFCLAIDLDELPELDRSLRWFKWNGFGLLSFFDRDHGPGDGGCLKAYVLDQLARANIDLGAGAKVQLLCYPRLLGYVFNPLSVYYCEDKTGSLRAILYEVSNTFGERHTYLIPVDKETSGRDGLVRQSCEKGFYVSPFIGMEATYHFRLTPLAKKMGLAIHQTDPEGPLLHASFAGTAEPMSDAGLVRATLKHPLMTLKVIAGIHWEALKLWLKGVPLTKRPPPPDQTVTIHSRPSA